MENTLSTFFDLLTTHNSNEIIKNSQCPIQDPRGNRPQTLTFNTEFISKLFIIAAFAMCSTAGAQALKFSQQGSYGASWLAL
jgi:hypothetical protein